MRPATTKLISQLDRQTKKTHADLVTLRRVLKEDPSRFRPMESYRLISRLYKLECKALAVLNQTRDDVVWTAYQDIACLLAIIICVWVMFDEGTRMRVGRALFACTIHFTVDTFHPSLSIHRSLKLLSMALLVYAAGVEAYIELSRFDISELCFRLLAWASKSFEEATLQTLQKIVSRRAWVVQLCLYWLKQVHQGSELANYDVLLRELEHASEMLVEEWMAQFERVAKSVSIWPTLGEAESLRLKGEKQ